MILDIKNINGFSDETLKNIINTCNIELSNRRWKQKTEKIKQIGILLEELSEINPHEVGWYDMEGDKEYTCHEFKEEFLNYHSIVLH